MYIYIYNIFISIFLKSICIYIYIWYPPPQLSTVFVGSLEPTRENPLTSEQ